MLVPHTVENVAIWIYSEHDVLHGGVVNERALGMNKENVRHPDFLHKPCVECPALVVAGWKGQSVVLPIMS